MLSVRCCVRHIAVCSSSSAAYRTIRYHGSSVRRGRTTKTARAGDSLHRLVPTAFSLPRSISTIRAVTIAGVVPTAHVTSAVTGSVSLSVSSIQTAASRLSFFRTVQGDMASKSEPDGSISSAARCRCLSVIERTFFSLFDKESMDGYPG